MNYEGEKVQQAFWSPGDAVDKRITTWLCLEKINSLGVTFIVWVITGTMSNLQNIEVMFMLW